MCNRRRKTNRQKCYLRSRMKHKLIYTEQTGDQFNNCFNRHRSDIRCSLDHCELLRRFRSNDCDFEKELKISILGKVKGSEVKGQDKEDQWIIRLGTSYSNNINVHFSDFGCIYQLLFK